MRHNLAGALILNPMDDDREGNFPIEQDTFSDFRTIESVNLNIPMRSIHFV